MCGGSLQNQLFSQYFKPVGKFELRNVSEYDATKSEKAEGATVPVFQTESISCDCRARKRQHNLTACRHMLRHCVLWLAFFREMNFVDL